jgi:hypothetical protein
VPTSEGSSGDGNRDLLCTQLFLGKNGRIHLDIVAQLQVLHGEVDDRRILLHEEVVASESLYVEDQVLWECVDAVGLLEALGSLQDVLYSMNNRASVSDETLKRSNSLP